MTGMDLTCGRCGRPYHDESGDAGGQLVCPACAQPQPHNGPTPVVRKTTTRGKILGWAIALGAAYFAFNFMCNSKPSSDDQLFNSTMFGIIGDAHRETFRESATRTRTALQAAQQAAANGSGKLDPRIPAFAQLQIEYEESFAQHARSEEEAFGKLNLIPLSLWEMQRRYHKAGRDLCVEYMPDWVSGLDGRIEDDNKIVARRKSAP